MQYVAIAGLAMSVMGSLQKGEDQQQQYSANAEASEYNAAIARQRAETSTQVYGQREDQQRRAARAVAGQTRAGIAQSGMGTGGTNADIAEQSEIAAELDALNIRYEGTLQKRSLLEGAALDDYQARVARWSGQQAQKTAGMGAVGNLLAGVGTYAKLGGSFGGSTSSLSGASVAPTMNLNGSFATFA